MTLTNCQRCLLTHFTSVGRSFPFQNYPNTPFKGEITEWLKFNDIFLAITNECPHTKQHTFYVQYNSK